MVVKKYVIGIQTDDNKLYILTRYEPDTEIVHIRCGYRSRSGAHWINCYDVDGNMIDGWISVVKRSITRITPLPLEELFKPIPKEVKNIVGIEVLKPANKEMVEAIIKYIKDLYGDYARNFIIVESNDGIEVALKAVVVPKKVYVFKAEKIASQGNLTIYIVHDFNLDINTPTRIDFIFNHRFEPAENIVSICLCVGYTYAELAKVLKPVTIVSPDHPEKIVLTPGVYLFTHPFPEPSRD